MVKQLSPEQREVTYLGEIAVCVPLTIAVTERGFKVRGDYDGLMPSVAPIRKEKIKPMRRFIPLLVLLSICASLSSADTYPRQPGVDALHYIFRLTLSDESDELVGETTVDLRFIRDGLTEVALDLASAANGKGMTVAEVTSGGAPARYTHQADRLRLTLTTASKAGERRQFIVRYRGVPANGLRMLKNKYGERVFFSENWPNNARQWLPMIDHPYDKATSEFIITAPARYQVVANGLLQEETDLGDGRRVTHWKQSAPIASWLNALGIAQFSAHHAGNVKGVEISEWVPPQEREAGAGLFDNA